MSTNEDPVEKIPGLVRKLYAIVAELGELFPGRRFTLDGHLVGSIGEVLAAHRYHLELLPASNEGHDAVAQDGKRVQIKATQGDSIAMRSEPIHLIVLRVNSDGTASEIYNGPGHPAWQATGPIQTNGQRAVSLSRLTGLMASVPLDARLPSVGAH